MPGPGIAAGQKHRQRIPRTHLGLPDLLAVSVGKVAAVCRRSRHGISLAFALDADAADPLDVVCVTWTFLVEVTTS